MEKEVKAVGRKAPIVKTNSKLKEYLRKPGSLIMLILIMLAAAITVGIMVYLVAYIVIRGVPYINADLFAWKYNSDNVSMTPAIINTIIIVAMTLIISVPIGVAAAIYLVEYCFRFVRFPCICSCLTLGIFINSRSFNTGNNGFANNYKNNRGSAYCCARLI